MGGQAPRRLPQPPGLQDLRALRDAGLPPVLRSKGRGIAGRGQGPEGHLPGPRSVAYAPRLLDPS
eukprot:15481709-Alexandrium_andersonii.AAC.1